MPISVDRFEAQGLFPTYNPFGRSGKPVSMFQVQCCNCGWEPNDIVLPKVCPKCHGSSFERFARPGSILENANRFDFVPTSKVKTSGSLSH